MKYSAILLLFLSTVSHASEYETESPKQKKGFWTFSFKRRMVPSKDPMKHRMHALNKLRLFDYVSIFQIKDEINTYANKAYELKTRFIERESLLAQERDMITKDLDSLIKKIKAGKDLEKANKECLKLYRELYDNTKKTHKLGLDHAKELHTISQEVYTDYKEKIENRIADYEKNPKELSDLLIRLHDDTGGFSKK